MAKVGLWAHPRNVSGDLASLSPFSIVWAVIHFQTKIDQATKLEENETAIKGVTVSRKLFLGNQYNIVCVCV